MGEDRAKAIESALLRVRDILYVKTTLSQDEQEIESLHVLARATRSSARICRDVQSVLNAQFGTDVDPSKIHIAQITGELETAIPPLRPRLKSVVYEIEGSECRVRVSITVEDRLVEGRATGGCSKTNRSRLVAAATLDAINAYLGDSITCELEDATEVLLSGQTVMVVMVRVCSPQRTETLTGCCAVSRDDLEAIARAILGSLNRRLPYHLKCDKR